MSHDAGADPIKVIKAALAANLAIAACKFVAAWLSDSTATLAEAVHSVADTGNQALLFVGVRLAARREDGRYPFGRAAERYFWPFIVSMLLFTLGGAFGLYEGIHKLAHPSPVHEGPFLAVTGPLASVVVLGVSVLLEGYSCSVALREFKKGAGGAKVRDALFGGKDPTIPLVLLEDVAALVGLGLALAAVILTTVTRNPVFDALGSVLIGVLLAVVAVLVARDTHDLLIGERATREHELEVQRVAEGTAGVRRVTQLLTMHLGPDFVVLAMKVAFEPTLSVAEVERAIDELEARVREAVPIMKKIFVEPDSRGDMRGVPEPRRSTPPLGEGA